MNDFKKQLAEMQPDRRMYTLQYLASHLADAFNLDRLYCLMVDFDFLEAKCADNLLFSLLEDYDRAIKLESASAMIQMRAALLLALPGLSEHPELVVQSLYNRLSWFDSLEPSLKTSLKQAYTKLNKQNCWISAEAPLPKSSSDSPFSFPLAMASTIQSMSQTRNRIAVGSLSGDIAIHDIVTGKVDIFHLKTPHTTTIAITDDIQSSTYMNREGVIHSKQGTSALHGRPNEKHILNLYPHGIIAVRIDNALVSWNPTNTESTVLARDLPYPLIVLHSNLSNRHIIFVAGHKEQMIGISTYQNDKWTTRLIDHAIPTVLDADLDLNAKHILFASMDRCVSILDSERGEIIARLFYQQHKTLGITGSPIKCAFGYGESLGWVFFCTEEGHVGCWNWEKNIVRRLENSSVGNALATVIQFVGLASGELFLSQSKHCTTLKRHHIFNKSSSKHNRRIDSCFITKSNKIVSMSKLDRSIRWYSPKNLSEPLLQLHDMEVTTIAPRINGDSILIGNRAGSVWSQSLKSAIWKQRLGLPIVSWRQKRRFFTQPVVSLFDNGNGSIFAADRSGNILQINLDSGEYGSIWNSTGFETQKKILPMMHVRKLWSIREEHSSSGTKTVVSIIYEQNKETIIYVGNLLDVAISDDGEMLCIITVQSVKILQEQINGWEVLYQRENVYIKQVAFLGKDNKFIAVVLRDEPWLEIWQVARDLPRLGCIYLPEPISSLATTTNNLVIGLDTGTLMLLRLHIGFETLSGKF